MPTMSPEAPLQGIRTKEQLLEAIRFSARLKRYKVETRPRLIGIPGTVSSGMITIAIGDLLIRPSRAPRISAKQLDRELDTLAEQSRRTMGEIWDATRGDADFGLVVNGSHVHCQINGGKSVEFSSAGPGFSTPTEVHIDLNGWFLIDELAQRRVFSLLIVEDVLRFRDTLGKLIDACRENRRRQEVSLHGMD